MSPQEMLLLTKKLLDTSNKINGTTLGKSGDDDVLYIQCADGDLLEIKAEEV